MATQALLKSLCHDPREQDTVQQTKSGLPYYDHNPCDFEQWHFVVMGKHDPENSNDPVPGQREAPHQHDPVPGRRMAHHVYDPVPGTTGHLGRCPPNIDDEEDEVELTQQHTGPKWSSDWMVGKQVRVVDDELDPEPCYAGWMAAKNDFVSVDILAQAVAKPELDGGLAMEELDIVVFVVALFLWCVEVVHALLVLAFTMGLTTFIEWVDPKIYDVTSWAKSCPAGPQPFWGTADRDATDHLYSFHPNGTEKWLPPLQEVNLVGYLECAVRCEASGDSRSGLAIARLRSSEFTTPLNYYAIDSSPSVGDGSGTVQLRQWTCTFQVAFPLLRCCAASHPPQRRQGATPDFTASSLLQQCFLERPAIVRLQVRSLTTVRQHEDAEEPGETSSTGGNVTPPSILASGLMHYWRWAQAETAVVAAVEWVR